MKKYSLTEHIFGARRGLALAGERLCTEPAIPGVKYHRIFHATFEMLVGGNARCFHCSEEFFEKEPL